ncbi:MAG: PAS domain S-box protein [Candidatus Hodarchaeota archaeon]
MARILLVDDNENLLYLTQKFLNREDPTFELVTALSAQEALQMLKEDHFDVVVSDYKMPHTNGLGFLKQLRDEDNLVPFILFTGHGREEVAMQALNLGADYYLMKGSDPQSLYGELAHIIRKLLKQSYAETALKESEKKYRTLVEQSLQALVIIQDGRIVFVNPAAEEPSGYTIEELYALSPEEFRSLIHPEDQDLIFNRLRDRLAGKNVPSRYECRLIHKSGKENWVELSSSVIEFRGRPAVQIAYIDITKYKWIQENLKEGEELFTQFMNHLPAAAFVKDSDGRTLYANQYLKDVFGGERWIGKTTEELFPEEIAQKMITNDQKALTEGLQIIIEELMDKNNAVNTYQTYKFPIKRKNKSTLLGGIAININEQKRIEKLLKEDEARLRQERDLLRHVTEMSPIGITIVDGEGKISFANKRAEDVLGLTRDKITSRTYNDPQWQITDFEGNPFPDSELPFSRVKTTRKPVYNVNHAIEWTDGRRVLLSINASPLFDELGQFSGMVASIEDITERKKIEAELRKQREELSQFAHTMSHDINNSLAIVDGYAQLLEDEYDKSHVERIVNQSNYMKKILKRSLVLADAGLIVEKINRLDLNLLVEEVAEIAIPADIVFSHDLLPTLLCDREKLSQIFKNLFENAVIHGEPSFIQVKHAISGKHKAILIVNDGTTISTEIKDKIFDHGFSTRKNSTGLGLTIVRKLVKAHGWEISVQSTPETTIFQIDYS